MDIKYLKLKLISGNKTLELGNKNYKIFNVDGLDYPDLELTVNSNAHYDGSVVTNRRVDKRYINLQSDYKGDGKEIERERLISFFNPKNKGKLIVDYCGLRRSIEYEVENFNSKLVNVYDDLSFTVDLICPNPFWQNITETETNLVSWIPNLEFPENEDYMNFFHTEQNENYWLETQQVNKNLFNYMSTVSTTNGATYSKKDTIYNINFSEKNSALYWFIEKDKLDTTKDIFIRAIVQVNTLDTPIVLMAREIGWRTSYAIETVNTLDKTEVKLKIPKNTITDNFIIALYKTVTDSHTPTATISNVIMSYEDIKYEEYNQDKSEFIEFQSEFGQGTGQEWGCRELKQIVKVNNTGDVKCPIRIVFRASADVEKPYIQNIESYELIRINKTLKTGDVLEITTGYGNKNIFLNGKKAHQYLDFLNSSWLQLKPGGNLIKYGAEKGLENLECTIFYTPLYLGV